jgi:hypothetical protein
LAAGLVVLRALKRVLATAATTEAKYKVDALIVDHHRFTCELRAALGIGRPAVMIVIIEHGTERFAKVGAERPKKSLVQNDSSSD